MAGTVNNLHILNRTFTIHSYEADWDKSAQLTAICNYFQEAAWEHAEILSVGYKDLEADNLLWVLSRFYVEMEEYPKWTDRVTVETWPKGIDRLFALRDFKLKNSRGEILGRATSAWLVLDHTTKRPQKADKYREVITIPSVEPAVNYRFGKLQQIENPDFIQSRSVVPSDIDLNNHVNNVKFIEWILDAEGMENKNLPGRPACLEIHFLAEGLYGDTISIRSSRGTETDEKKYYEGKRENDGGPLFRAVLHLNGP